MKKQEEFDLGLTSFSMPKRILQGQPLETALSNRLVTD